MKALTHLLGLGLVSTLAAQSPLTTTFAGGNGLLDGGVVFINMTVNVPAITVNRLDVNSNAAAGTEGRIRFWQTLPAFPFFSGSEGVAANWQLIGEGNVIAAGAGNPSTVCFEVPITLTSAMGGRGYAVEYIGIGPAYTNGTGANQIYNNNEISLNAGAAGAGSPYTDQVAAGLVPGGGVNPFWSGTNNPRVFNGAIHYAIGTSAPVCSYSNRFARGCGDSADSFIDVSMWPPEASARLTGRQVTMALNAFGGYTVITGPSPGLIPTTTATPLGGWTTTIAGAVATDDGELVQPLTNGFPHPGGIANSLVIHNGGMISTGSNEAFFDTLGGDTWAPTTQLLNAPNTAWYSWHDFDLTTAGTVFFEEIGSLVVVTWSGVESYGSPGTSSTFQFTFDTASGTVTIAWQTVDPVSVPNPIYSGNPWIVGFSPDGNSPRPEIESDITQNAVVDLVGTGQVSPSLVLSSEPRPVFGTVINYTVGQFPLYQNGLAYGFPFGLLHYSVANPAAPGLPLALFGIGRPGCLLNFDLASPIGPFTFLAPGPVMSIDTNTVVPSMLGLEFWGQAAVVDVAGDLLGSMVMSNALHQRCEAN